jgi:hypothetical protein
LWERTKHLSIGIEILNFPYLCSNIPASPVGIPAAAPKGQSNLGAEGNPQVFQVTTYQLGKFAFE